MGAFGTDLGDGAGLVRRPDAVADHPAVRERELGIRTTPGSDENEDGAA